MPKVNLSGMSFEALMDLREQVDETLVKRGGEIEKQLKRMGAVVDGARVIRGKPIERKESRTKVSRSLR